LKKLFVDNIINHLGLLLGRKTTVEVSACSVGCNVFMNCFLLLWYQQLLWLRLNLRGQPVMTWDVEKEITGGVVFSGPKGC